MLDRYLEATRSLFRRAAQVGCVGMAHNDCCTSCSSTAAIDAPTLKRTAGRDLKRGICERKHVTTLMECAFENPIGVGESQVLPQDLVFECITHISKSVRVDRQRAYKTVADLKDTWGRRSKIYSLPACCTTPLVTFVQHYTKS